MVPWRSQGTLFSYSESSGTTLPFSILARVNRTDPPMLTQQAARGASLMLSASLLGRFAALIAQVVTGLVLINEDFGVFAIAIGIQSIAGVLQGGNALSYLVTLPPSKRRFRTGTVFGICNGFYLVGVIPMLLFAPAIAAHFD